MALNVRLKRSAPGSAAVRCSLAACDAAYDRTAVVEGWVAVSVQTGAETSGQLAYQESKMVFCPEHGRIFETLCLYLLDGVKFNFGGK